MSCKSRIGETSVCSSSVERGDSESEDPIPLGDDMNTEFIEECASPMANLLSDGRI